jgi:AraC-like DNA-binding protein
MSKIATIALNVQELDGIIFEQYTYTKGSVLPLPKHSHENHQLGMNLHQCGEYHYRGNHQYIPPLQLCIIQSGEVHLPNQRTEIDTPMHCLMMEIPPKLLLSVATEKTKKEIKCLTFPELVITDSSLSNLFRSLHTQIKAYSGDRLKQDYSITQFLSQLIARHSQEKLSNAEISQPRAIQRVLDFLNIYYAENISLNQLSSVAGLSRFHLCRSFHKAVGISPHIYQTQRRVEQARRMLMKRMPLSQVSSELGFADQSHFGQHFKRIVGVTPKEYCQSSNILIDNSTQR